MTIPYDIQVSGKLSSKEKELIENYIKTFFHELDNTINHWNLSSELYQITKSPYKSSTHLLNLIKLSINLKQRTDGHYDPSIHPIIKTWKEHLSLGKTPQNLLKKSSFGLSELSIQNNQIHFEGKFPILDFDGISKGYALDEMTKGLQNMGYNNLFLNWGGEIKASGNYDKSRCWKVLVASPICPKNYESFDLKNMAIATSADYEQLFKVDQSTIYTHIINPQTLKAVKVSSNSLCSVTVMHKSCAIADALATAAMTFEDKSSLKQWVSKIQSSDPNTKFWLFFRDDKSTD